MIFGWNKKVVFLYNSDPGAYHSMVIECDSYPAFDVFFNVEGKGLMLHF